MPARVITVDAQRWEVRPTGRVTQYDKDEFGVMFIRQGDKREVRVTRYSPLGARWRDQSLSELGDADLRRLLEMSQPSFTSPEAGYSR